MNRLLAIAFAFTVGCYSGNKGQAEAAATSWAKQMGLDLVGVSCADSDSDDDGYVSCSASIRSKSGEVSVQPVECARKQWTFNDGCRVPRFKLGSQ